MKSYIRITSAVAVMFLAGIIILIVMTSGKYTQGISNEKLTALNDIARTAEEHRSELSMTSKLFDDLDTDVDFVIIDMTDNVLYTHSVRDISDEKLSAETAIKNRYPYQYLKDESGVWGCVILLDDGTESYRVLRMRFIIGMSIGAFIILLGMAGFGIYIKRNIVTPFGRMKDFAGRVAQGRLDEPLEMDRENLFGAFSESFDIMREELAETKQRELELQKKERELVASLSHDLKTPVTGIKLAAELLQMRLSVRSQSEDGEVSFGKDEISSMSDSVEGILQRSEQINALVSDLFTSALDDLGEFKVNCRDEDSRVLGDMVKSCDDRHLAVIGDIPEVIISIDKKRMSQVIGNIISNSYKYADTPIDVSFRLSEGFLEMCMQDHGQGVARDEIELITNKFYRGKAWADSDTEGNGLGLYIAKTLMTKMDGDLIPESGGDGLAVTLVIPIS